MLLRCGRHDSETVRTGTSRDVVSPMKALVKPPLSTIERTRSLRLPARRTPHVASAVGGLLGECAVAPRGLCRKSTGEPGRPGVLTKEHVLMTGRCPVSWPIWRRAGREQTRV